MQSVQPNGVSSSRGRAVSLAPHTGVIRLYTLQGKWNRRTDISGLVCSRSRGYVVMPVIPSKYFGVLGSESVLDVFFLC